jgi:succinate dehydrogenase/fumarate reductase-like Fe-S protein
MKLRIQRSTGRVDEYEVPGYEGMTVLDALLWVREHHDPSLAFRFACRCANACKECVAVVDGERAYTCTVAAVGEVGVEPLPNKPLLHDLGVDL